MVGIRYLSGIGILTERGRNMESVSRSLRIATYNIRHAVGSGWRAGAADMPED